MKCGFIEMKFGDKAQVLCRYCLNHRLCVLFWGIFLRYRFLLSAFIPSSGDLLSNYQFSQHGSYFVEGGLGELRSGYLGFKGFGEISHILTEIAYK